MSERYWTNEELSEKLEEADNSARLFRFYVDSLLPMINRVWDFDDEITERGIDVRFRKLTIDFHDEEEAKKLKFDEAKATLVAGLEALIAVRNKNK